MSSIEVFWRIDRLEWDVVQGGIVTAHWSVVAKEGNIEGSTSGRTDFSPDPNDSSFISIKDITEEQVLSWVKKDFVDKQLDFYEGRARTALVKAKMPPLVSGLPWKQPLE